VDNLHRHPNYAPVKKEPTQDDSGKAADDNDLPLCPNELSTNSIVDTLTFEADAEFGSKLIFTVAMLILC
jgi:DNA repair and recombination protein RAD52